VALPVDRHAAMVDLVKNLNNQFVDVRIVPDLLQCLTLRSGIEDLDGIPIAGANALSYTILAVALTDAGTYKAGVRNAAGEVLSSAALLTVHPAPIPKLNLKREINGRLTFTWTGTAKLMWSPSVSGPFNLVPGAVSGYQALPGTGTGFYRLGL
jgi:hypothetical protein